MPFYKRVRLSGGTYFFTVNLENRNSRLLIDNYDHLIVSIKKVKKERPFQMPGWVILPDHIHCIWTLPEKDSDYPGRWRAIKTLFTKYNRDDSRNEHRKVWQNRFWEHCLRNETDFFNHLDYIHINPMKHGYVSQVCDWPFSSFHHHVLHGRYAKHWGGKDGAIYPKETGERD